ncbi:MAG TPA: zinc ribbon domain-containing protein [Blastocatellia bacterium]|nr:zinc ribbon domain-containing protein [Blastocatellia bacterium]
MALISIQVSDMYCPKCAAENSDGSKFCRQCGSNIALVPQALSGMLPDGRESDEVAATKIAGKVESGVKKTVIGLCFALAAAVMMLSGRHDGLVFLVPAAILLGKGVSQILALRYLKYAGLLTVPKASQPGTTGSLDQSRERLLDTPIPPSVTEHTTRHMNQPAQDRQ